MNLLVTHVLSEPLESMPVPKFIEWLDNQTPKRSTSARSAMPPPLRGVRMITLHPHLARQNAIPTFAFQAGRARLKDWQ
jgi:hypothetical protein